MRIVDRALCLLFAPGLLAAALGPQLWPQRGPLAWLAALPRLPAAGGPPILALIAAALLIPLGTGRPALRRWRRLTARLIFFAGGWSLLATALASTGTLLWIAAGAALLATWRGPARRAPPSLALAALAAWSAAATLPLAPPLTQEIEAMAARAAEGLPRGGLRALALLPAAVLLGLSLRRRRAWPGAALGAAGGAALDAALGLGDPLLSGTLGALGVGLSRSAAPHRALARAALLLPAAWLPLQATWSWDCRALDGEPAAHLWLPSELSQGPLLDLKLRPGNEPELLVLRDGGRTVERWGVWARPIDRVGLPSAARDFSEVDWLPWPPRQPLVGELPQPGHGPAHPRGRFGEELRLAAGAFVWRLPRRLGRAELFDPRVPWHRRGVRVGAPARAAVADPLTGRAWILNRCGVVSLSLVSPSPWYRLPWAIDESYQRPESPQLPEVTSP